MFKTNTSWIVAAVVTIFLIAAGMIVILAGIGLDNEDSAILGLVGTVIAMAGIAVPSLLALLKQDDLRNTQNVIKETTDAIHYDLQNGLIPSKIAEFQETQKALEDCEEEKQELEDTTNGR